MGLIYNAALENGIIMCLWILVREMLHFWYFFGCRCEQNEVDDFLKSTSRDKSTNRDSPSSNAICLTIKGTAVIHPERNVAWL